MGGCLCYRWVGAWCFLEQIPALLDSAVLCLPYGCYRCLHCIYELDTSILAIRYITFIDVLYILLIGTLLNLYIYYIYTWNLLYIWVFIYD